MTDTTAKIRAKGLDATGVTEKIANEYYAAKGRHFMFIGEYKVDETHDKADGHKGVDLIITQVEPATDPMLEDHLRQLTRTLHQNRVLTSEDVELPIDGKDDLEPKVEDVIAARRAHDAGQPHAFDSDGNADETPRCLLCGETNDDELHVELVDAGLDDDEDETEEDGIDDDQAATDPWDDRPTDETADTEHDAEEPVPVA